MTALKYFSEPRNQAPERDDKKKKRHSEANVIIHAVTNLMSSGVPDRTADGSKSIAKKC